MKDYIIGVDSGGTSTVADAYDLNGDLLLSADGGYGNLLVNEEIALENLKQTVDKIFSKLGTKNCKAIIFGIAGVDSGDYKQTILDAFVECGSELVVLNDAWLAHYALLQGADGCLIISGTGSIAIGRYHGEEKRVGGWGNLLGDEGSGFDIAKKLIVSVLNAYDEGRPFTKLEQSLLELLEFETPFELVSYVYLSSKDKIAKLALFIAEEAAKNNQQAINILESTGVELGSQAIKLLNKVKTKGELQIAVTGSVLLNNDTVYHSFVEKVQMNFTDCKFIRKNISNTVGSYYYYQKNQ